MTLFDDNGNVTGIFGRRINHKVKADDITIGSGNVDVFSELVAPGSEASPSDDSVSQASGMFRFAFRGEQLGTAVLHFAPESTRVPNGTA